MDRNSTSATILGVCLILAALVGSITFYKVRSFDNALQVTGSAKQRVTSDTVKWTGTFSRSVGPSQLKNGYAALARDAEIVAEFFKKEGITEKDIVFSPVTADQPYKWSQGGNTDQYEVRQTVQINSTDVKKITELSRKIQPIVDQGVLFSTQSLEYYYSKLSELRIQLLSAAVKDAKLRAESIAKSSGRGVGTMKSASVGVVQVLPLNSVDVSDYGTYDTSGVEKEVMATVRAAFVIR